MGSYAFSTVLSMESLHKLRAVHASSFGYAQLVLRGCIIRSKVFHFKKAKKKYYQRTLSVGGSIPLGMLVPSFTSLDSTDSLHTNKNTFSFLVKSRLVKRAASHIVILPPMVSVL